MALGDGLTWDEAVPTDATSAVQIDDYNRDLRKGVRLRMTTEHEWPASQAATSEAGQHKYITFQSQAAKPTLAGTQVNAIYASTNNLWFEKSDGTTVVIVSGTAVGDGKILANSTDAASGYLLQKLDTAYLTMSGTNVQVLETLVDFRFYGASVSTGTTTGLSNLIIIAGRAVLASGTASISNLPFANTNYGISLVRNTYHDETPFATSVTSSSFKIDGQLSNSDEISWIAIGV